MSSPLDETSAPGAARAVLPQLENLNNTELTLADASADIRGRKVIDAHGDEVGDVSSLFIDTHERKVRMLEIRAGGFLGLGERHWLVPSESVTSVTKHAVRLNQSREHILNSPAYDPELVQVPVNGYWEPFYGYYGLRPYDDGFGHLRPHDGFGSLDSAVPLSRDEQPVLDVHSEHTR